MTARIASAICMLVLAGCTSTYESSWADPDASRPLRLKGEPVAVFLLGAAQPQREVVETVIAREVSDLGAEGIPGHDILTFSQLYEPGLARQAIKERGIKGALVLRVVGEDQQVRYVPGRDHYAAYPYGNMWNYWQFGGVMVYEPGRFDVERRLYVEAVYYSVTDDRLIWGGISRMSRQGSFDRMLDRFAQDTVQEMRAAGLLARR